MFGNSTQLNAEKRAHIKRKAPVYLFYRVTAIHAIANNESGERRQNYIRDRILDLCAYLCA